VGGAVSKPATHSAFMFMKATKPSVHVHPKEWERMKPKTKKAFVRLIKAVLKEYGK
jgi:hypothetical protein